MTDTIEIGGRVFDTNDTYVMGILNVTPDSFSDGGKYETTENALRHADVMLKEGADIIDVGGESTRPGYTQISEETEINRIVPVIEALKARFDTPVSVDTYKSAVADAALSAGADMVNDIWGLRYDERMAPTVWRYDVPVCLMHNRREADYRDFIADVLGDLKKSIHVASTAGIDDDKIIIDPGVGFAKSTEQNLTILKYLDRIRALGYPVLLGTSRKSVIGNTLNLPRGERVEGTLVTTVMAVIHGCMFVRVHDVKENVRAVKMTKAILEV